MKLQILLLHALMGVFTLTSVAEDNIVVPHPDTDYTEAQASNIVTKAYRDVLHRDPDPEGLKTFTKYLLAGQTEQWLFTVLRESPEAQAGKRAVRMQAFQLFLWPAICVMVAAGIGWMLNQKRMVRFPTLLVLTIAFPAFFFFLIWQYAVNVPSWDDFDAILGYLSTPWQERLTALFHQHNEHRIVMTRLIADLSNTMLGSVNFKAIALIGNGFLIGVLVLLARELRRDRGSVNYIPVVSAIVFLPLAWLNMAWATTGVQNNAIHFFAFLSIAVFFSSRKMSYRLIAIGSVLCATLTSASGLFVLPAILITLMARQFLPFPGYTPDDSRQTINDLAVVFMGMLLVVPVYFIGYQPPAGSPSIMSSLANPLRTIHYTMCFLGSILDDRYAATIAGALAIVLLLTFTILKGYRKSPVLYSMVVYFFITAVMASLARSGFGVDQALSTRYRINSLLMFTALLVLSIRMLPRLLCHPATCVVILSLVLLGYSWCVESTISSLQGHRKVLVVETAKWIAFRHGLHYPREHMEHAGRIFDKAVNEGCYIPPQYVRETAAEYDRGIPRMR